MQTYNPTVFIQWSCDPKPYYDIEDEIYEERVRADSKGLVNSRLFWKDLSKKTKKIKFSKHYKPLTTKLNQDFNTVREYENCQKKQYFYDYDGLNASQIRHFKYLQRNFMKNMDPSVSFIPDELLSALKNGNVVYLPIHGGHPLDEKLSPNIEYTLPENTFVITFNPPNSSSGFLSSQPTLELLNFLTDPMALIYISKTDKRKKTFEREFYKSIRIWGPNDKIINRSLVTDSNQDLQIKYSNTKTFQRLSKARLRKETNHTIENLFNEIIKTT